MDAPKTIRDEITRRSRVPRWISIAAGVGFAAVYIALRSNALGLPAHTARVSSLGALILFVIATTLGTRLLRKAACPKCQSPLGAFAYFMTDTPKRKKINFCPYCAVNLDDPLPEAAAPAENVTTPDKLVWK